MLTYFRSDHARYGTNKRFREDICDRSIETRSQLASRDIRNEGLVVQEVQDDALNSRKGRNDKKNNKPKVFPKHPKQIKRCTLSLYGNRPSYGIQTLHTDLWE